MVKADFFIDDARRLTDEERSLMAGMLRGLVFEIADELMAALPALLAARAEADRAAVYTRLRESRLLERDGVIALLLRRADEQRLAGRSSRDVAALPAALVGDADPTVAEAAMGVTIARGQRTDRFGRLGITVEDFPAEDAVAIVHAVAAALRPGLETEADYALASAARDLLARFDESRRVEAAVQQLARALDSAGHATDDMVRKAAETRDVGLLVALLSRRAGIAYEDGWALFTGGDAMVLARLAQCDRATAGQIVAAFDPALGDDSPDRSIEFFDAMTEVQVDRYRDWLRLDPHYREALDRIEPSNG